MKQMLPLPEVGGHLYLDNRWFICALCLVHMDSRLMSFALAFTSRVAFFLNRVSMHQSVFMQIEI